MPTVTLHYYAYDTSAKTPKTGDAANHTIYACADGVVASVAGTTPTEIDSVKLPGWYKVTYDTIVLGIASARYLLIGGKSSTANVVIPGHQIPNTIPLVSSLQAGAITESSITPPAEAAGRPTGILAMIRRTFEAAPWGNKRVRNRTAMTAVLRNQGDTADLVTESQSTATAGGVTTDTQTAGA